jgi:Uma2 family endonuclease
MPELQAADTLGGSIEAHQVARTTGAIQVGPQMTYEEFMEWADDRHLEWVNGKAYLLAPPSTRHQQLVTFLTKTFGFYVDEKELGQVIVAPFQMNLETGREPDLIFVAAEHTDRLEKNRLDGPADLAVEVVSPSSGARDRGEKFYEYESGGVREYWLVDPDRTELEVYRLTDEGRYRSTQPEDGSVYRSEVVPGFWLDAAWLWRDPLPKTMDVLHAWDLV